MCKQIIPVSYKESEDIAIRTTPVERALMFFKKKKCRKIGIIIIMINIVIICVVNICTEIRSNSYNFR